MANIREIESRVSRLSKQRRPEIVKQFIAEATEDEIAVLYRLIDQREKELGIDREGVNDEIAERLIMAADALFREQPPSHTPS